MSSEWVKIYSTEDFFKSEVVKSILEEEEIKPFVLNKKDSMHIHLSNGEIEVYVKPEYVIKAKHILSKNEI